MEFHPVLASTDRTTSAYSDDRKLQTDCLQQPFTPPPVDHETGAVHTGTPCSSSSDVIRGIYKQQLLLAFDKIKQQQQSGRHHQSVSMV